MPERIQQRRTAGWRKPEGAKSVSRSTRWGNPWRLAKKDERFGPLTVIHTRHGWPTGAAYGGFADELEAIRFAIDLNRRSILAALERNPASAEYYIGPLVGLDLMCFCPLDRPCHADMLLVLAREFEQGLPLTGLLDATLSQ